MKNNMLFVLLLVGLILVSGCTQEEKETKNLSADIKPIENLVPYKNDLYTLNTPVNWEIEQNDAFTYFKSPPTEDQNNLQENVVVYVQPLESPNQSLIDFFQKSVETLLATVSEFTILNHREDNLGGVPAYRIIYTEGEEGSKIKYLQVFAVKGSNGYILTYTAPTDTFDTYLPKAEAIINSYRIA